MLLLQTIIENVSGSATKRSNKLKKESFDEDKRYEDDDSSNIPHKKMRSESSADASVCFKQSPCENYDGLNLRLDLMNEKMESKKKIDALVLKEKVPSDSNKVNDDMMEEKKQDNEKKENSGSQIECRIHIKAPSSCSLQMLIYPDPEFCNFEKFRDVSQFAVNQIWALYDDADGMPRCYAQIRKVYARDSQLRFTWLEPSATDQADIPGPEPELPIACGNFKLGKSEYKEDLLMFSHMMSWERGTSENTYDIYPRKGEVWALLNSWSPGCGSDSDGNKHYQYEVVEILSDFTMEAGADIIPLVRIKGFVSLFIRAKERLAFPDVIAPNETLRFSHKVPSYRLTGTEREGIPEGSFELDLLSLPSNYKKEFPSISLSSCRIRAGKLDLYSGSCLRDTNAEEAAETCIAHTRSADRNQHLSSNATKSFIGEEKIDHTSENQHEEACGHALEEADQAELEINGKGKICMGEIDKGLVEGNSDENVSFMLSSRFDTIDCPDSEFHDFGEERSIKNFQCGQIWAGYWDIDKYPRYYGWVKRVDLENCRVHVTWLEPCPIQQEEKRWLKEDLPISSGTYNLPSAMTIEHICTFSHIVQAKQKDVGQYVILPSSGEIWAVYKNWRVGWSRSDLVNCVYKVVEIHNTTASGIEVRLLTKVDGYRSVFKPQKDGKAATTIEIPVDECIRFSHKIPAFKLTDESSGKLHGYWELDPASVPEHLLFEKQSESENEEKDELDTGDADDENVAENGSLSAVPYISNCSLDYPEPEFHDFEGAKMIKNLCRGQVWALYSDIDTYPKYYGWVKKVELEKACIHLSWLELCPAQEIEKRWLEEELPISCGTFKVIQQSMIFEGTESFSHLMQAKPTGRDDHYVILPTPGEIWTIYKNWQCGWSLSDLENSELDVIEICETTGSGTIVRPLTKVDGYKAVFKPKRNGEDSRTTMEIPVEEYVRFSHQIPAFKLTDERGKLQGCWELDAASVPRHLLLLN